MAHSTQFLDPLRINLRRQIQVLLAQLPHNSLYTTQLQQVGTRPELLTCLSRLLAIPALTDVVAKAFRPILIDLCARWLHDDENDDEKLEALCLLLEIHPELYTVLSALLRRHKYSDGPLHYVVNAENIASLDRWRLHRSLLAYYRILQANRDLPRVLCWPLSPLSKLIWDAHPDNGVRFLAIRCYALQTGMIEGERVKIEKEVVGDVEEVDCTIFYGMQLDGTHVEADGWIMPALEVKRVTTARNAHLEALDFYEGDEGETLETIHPTELSPWIVNIHGVLLLRTSLSSTHQETIIETPTTIQSLRALAIHHSLRVPTMLTSAPSAGKSLLLSHLASVLHNEVRNQIVTIHLADTSLDPRSLIGSYISSPTDPGTFEWKEGVLVRAMREGRWVVFEDIDRGSLEVLGVIKPLVESLCLDKWIGGRAVLEVPGRGTVQAEDGFAIFATRSISPSRNGIFPSPTFYGAHKFHEVVVASPTAEDLRMIIDAKFPRLAGVSAQCLIRLWDGVKALGNAASTREVGLRELEKLCRRIDNVLPLSTQHMDIDMDPNQPLSLSIIFPNPSLREDMFLEARDVFFGAGATTTSARAHLDAIAAVVAEHFDLSQEKRDWLLRGRTPEFDVEKDVNGRTTAVRAGRVRLPARTSKQEITPPVTRPFAMHRPAVQLISRIATAVSLNEPVLLTGETGTGKTSAVTHLAALLRRPLVSLNLSNQTESSDIVGGFKPVDTRVPAMELQDRFLELFGRTFSRKKNAKFEESVRKAVQEGKWKRAAGLWLESAKLAKDKMRAKITEEETKELTAAEAPRKRRKVDGDGSEDSWEAFHRDVRTFEVQHVKGKAKLAFSFVEGPLVKALRSGDWVLLDEVNLATPETLECISALLHGPTSSITLTEQGSLEPIPRHPDFRLFACMNPATDVGKKDLPPNIRSRFTEIDVPPPDADRETLLSIVTQYIGGCAVGDKGAILDVAEFYSEVKKLADERQLADGSNHRPHFSMRTLARALTFAADMAANYSLRRALWEGCLMAFTMVLDEPSAAAVTALAQKHILNGVRNPRSLLSREPTAPQPLDNFVKVGPFYLQRGPLPEESIDDYIMTPSVEAKLINLARIIAAKRFPILIEGPTSAGKTSSIEYLAKRTGHTFVRINNHEHTDIQEYLGTYVSDPVTGKLVFKDGLLVRALRYGHWIVLDELNLAPTDVLEALNRLLDDNRELIIPETQEVVRPHPHFMLFATQNPPGLYAGRKVLSRAFRNRFLEVHFEDVPQAELETILCQRCRIAPSYGQRIVSVFRELQKRRQSSRVFESKHGFATLRDLFRWAGRDAGSVEELATNGYMLLAERTRREDDKVIVKDIIESVMKVRIDENKLYDFRNSQVDLSAYLGCRIPSESRVVWTAAMQRLYILVARALRFNEPVLLVGETGCGKTSVCQLYAEVLGQELRAVSCHQNTETADLIGGLRPVRNRGSMEAEFSQEAMSMLQGLGISDLAPDTQTLVSTIDQVLKSGNLGNDQQRALQEVRARLQRLTAMFEWHDGPLVEAMRNGDVFLLDEISLADDSVLERLNSVLETGRTVVLAERGGDEAEVPSIKAADRFKILATMNPGGDYGKKELSPALRNRFTEIWVPPVTDRSDLECIVNHLWAHDSLHDFTAPLLDFVDWLCVQVGDRSVLSLRDILAWVAFMNTACQSGNTNNNLVNESIEVFHHAAHMTFLDGLASIPQLSAYSPDNIERLKSAAILKLQELVPLTSDVPAQTAIEETSTNSRFGPFSVPRGPIQSSLENFSLHAPTTRENVLRIARACQLPKPILLEGSPGVGKTSIISALARICGHHLCRINLSDQTDLVDLFGSDLPVEGGAPGQFAWRDAEFLRAMQEGHWVLLDEMNLAPQAILEGLNAVLDHRGTVYIPELGRTFSRHPSFRIFAAQNPLQQGGGRKGLPRSFLNRFTKVYVQELRAEDLLLVCQNLFPKYPTELLLNMIESTRRLHEEVMQRRSFGRQGSPWEFNLRDIIRWGTLLNDVEVGCDPASYLPTVFLNRFRTIEDREQARLLLVQFFPGFANGAPPSHSISPRYLQIGQYVTPRDGFSLGRRPGRLLQTHVAAMESIGVSALRGWLTILTGSRDSGKTHLVRLLAHLRGRSLTEVSINNASDTTDILGSFEAIDVGQRMAYIKQDLLSLWDELSSSLGGSVLHQTAHFNDLMKSLRTYHSDPSNFCLSANVLLDALGPLPPTHQQKRDLLKAELRDLSAMHAGKLEWVDGPLVRAMREGYWLLLDGANLCSPSVLDRLNSLCETNGILTLNERGSIHGEVQILRPHPQFRLFMCVDPQHGDLSRAMRNRGIEVAITGTMTGEDNKRLADHLRLPLAYAALGRELKDLAVDYECTRRGIILQRSDSLSQDQNWPSGRLLGEDSVAAALVNLAPSLAVSTPSSLEQRSMTHFTVTNVAPVHLPHTSRLLTCAGISHAESDLRVVLSSVRALGRSRLRVLLTKLREGASKASGAPLELLLTQPIDCATPSTVARENVDLEGHWKRTCLRSLRLFATLHCFNEEAKALSIHEVSSIVEAKRELKRGVVEARYLVEAIEVSAQALLENLAASEKVSNEILLELSTRLVAYAQHLTKAALTEPFNYSAAQTLLAWILELVTEQKQVFREVNERAMALQSAISLKSGFGLGDIWTSLSSPYIPDSHLKMTARLEGALDSVDEPNMRCRVLELMTMWLMPQLPPEIDRQELVSLTEAITTNIPAKQDRIDESMDGTASGSRVTADPIFLSLELSVISSLNEDGGVLHEVLDSVQSLLRFGIQDPHYPLSHLSRFQQLLWSQNPLTCNFFLSQQGPSTDDCTTARRSMIIDLIRQWLRAIWKIPSIVDVEGPSVLSRATMLHTTLQDCDWASKPLIALKSYEKSLKRRLRMFSTGLLGKVTRHVQMKRLLAYIISMIASCFGDQRPPSWSSLGALIEDLDRRRHVAFDAAYRRHLRPALHRLSCARQVESVSTLVGRCWIALCQFLLDLYVPDAPVDPLSMQQCSREFWNEQQTMLDLQIQLHRQHAMRTHGIRDGYVTAFLDALLHEAKSHITSSSPLLYPPRQNVMALHAYWTEVSQFISHVIRPAKIHALTSSLENREEASLIREQVVEESISSFIQRLQTAHSAFADINGPLELALSSMKLGLRLMADEVRLSQVDAENVLSFASALVASPSIRSAEILCNVELDAGASESVFTGLLPKLAAITMEWTFTGRTTPLLRHVKALYEQAYGLWSIDRARREDREREAQSLYRQHSASADADLEEDEFLRMFPQYEDVFDDPKPEEQKSSHHPALLVDAPQLVHFVWLHDTIFANEGENSTDVSSLFISVREVLTTRMFVRATYPESLDMIGRAFQIYMLDTALGGLLKDSATIERRPYNFYSDANVPEARKALEILQSLRSRLDVLVHEWPEQMVLQHLLSRCVAILEFNLRSPIPKFLSALEQLLVQTDDWEMYSNRDNTLKNHQQQLTGLIVEWRRLELACWQDLLRNEARTFADGASEWWFRLYETTVRGGLAAQSEETHQGGSMTTYLDSLVPLLDEFMTTSPLGQFHARIRLLHSFESYIAHLCSAGPTSEASDMHRVERVLHHTRQFYAQFSQQVSVALSKQQSELEKGIRDFIKLASWKDINVHALKQSAQRTHRQLYKCIRKFRDVLRQPVTDFFQRKADMTEPESSPYTPVALKVLSEQFVLPEYDGRPDLPPHLVNLARTFRNFQGIISERICGSIDSLSPKEVDGFAVEIITTTKTLAESAAPSNLTAAQKTKFLKALLGRKRKAWSDLLKELKRLGFAPNMKPEALEQLRSRRWIRERSMVANLARFAPTVRKADDYFHRISAVIPDLRNSLSDHHSDLSGRELQRALMLLESSFSIALEARSSASDLLGDFQQLQDTIARLRTLRSSQVLAVSDSRLLEHVRRLGADMSKLEHALVEARHHLRAYRQHLLDTSSPSVVADELQSLIQTTQAFAGELSETAKNIGLTSASVLLESEGSLVTRSREHLFTALDWLAKWSDTAGVEHHLLQPIHDWLQERVIPQTMPAEPTAQADHSDSIIDILLVRTQALLSIAPAPTTDDADELKDNFVRDSCRIVSQMTHTLGLAEVLQHLNAVVPEVASCPAEEKEMRLARLMPFVEQYFELAERQILNHCEWTKTMFKLVFVLCSVVQRVAKEGFCKPPEMEESGSGEEGTEQTSGTGMGEGTGTENVSKEIEDESQVEGLQGENDANDEPVERAEEGNAIEMSEDIGGEMQDVEEGEEGEEEEEGSEQDHDEQIGDLDASDPSAVDEKLWGDESGPKDEEKGGGKTDKDHAEGNQQDSETVAKDSQDKQQSSEKKTEEAQKQPDEAGAEENGEEELEEPDVGQDGAPMDDYVKDAETLDLPDNLDLDPEKEQQELGDNLEMDDVEGEEPLADGPEETTADDVADMESEDERIEGQGVEGMDDEAPEVPPEEKEGAVANPDLHSGEGQGDAAAKDAGAGGGNEAEPAQAEAGESRAQGEAGSGAQSATMETHDSQPQPFEAVDETGDTEGDGEDATGAGQLRQGAASTRKRDEQSSVNPQRSLGDAFREIRQTVNEILSSQNPQDQTTDVHMDDAGPGQLEYLQNDDESTTMQALGPAMQEEVAKLNELNILDQTEDVDHPMAPVTENPSDVQEQQTLSSRAPLQAESTSERHAVESALTQSEVRSQLADQKRDLEEGAVLPSQEPIDEALMDPQDLEVKLKEWHAHGQDFEGAADMWRRYESLTHDLSYALCEQLRLILEPTLATRLRGDYRTGKRLNMKKIIPYIASEFTKDKIWLRRTRPSQREYQVLIALDDSKSMLESHSIHLAYETLALVTKALGRLEVGDVGIAKFGESVEVLHGFDSGPFTDQAGAKVMTAFRFDQKSTQVLSLVETSLKLLEEARDRRSISSASSAELWQLEIIISDGICQDHERLRTVLRKAEEQRVMVVFIILDSLHTKGAVDGAAAQNSILSMNRVAYKNIGGKVDLHVERYLDSFPFEYYVVLRDVEALPDVLSGTLKQFFERISEE
ncbi:midasin [Obba rivulosa]|uniref:Midasin n=1 Tax=Obba rivulosa TaxID=1052685 RepID=A0A8E2AUP5_9APHY|nr:midasin [Obba rivulosa]